MSTWSLANDLKAIADAVSSQEYRLIARVVRHIPIIRKKLSPEVLHPGLSGDITRKCAECLSLADASPKTVQPVFEVQMYVCLLSGVYLMDSKQYTQAQAIFSDLIERLSGKHKPASDYISAKVFYFFAVVCEKQGILSQQYNHLMGYYRTAVLHRNLPAQAVLLNTLLRILVNDKLYEQATKLIEKTQFPETRSNADYARYMYYLGRVKAVTLEYSDAHAKLSQASKKAPTGKNGRGFRITANIFALVVELLMGDIPDRTVFNDKDIGFALKPYLSITQAVRAGSPQKFAQVLANNQTRFERDGTLSLIRRLHHNVLKAGLRAINSSYSRISLADVAKKLGLETAADAYGIAAKAIDDGVVDATINKENGLLESSWRGDLYSTTEPQKQMHRRIAFCLQLHTDTLKAMRFPDNSKAKLETIEDLRRREEEEFDMNDEDDFDMM